MDKDDQDKRDNDQYSTRITLKILNILFLIFTVLFMVIYLNNHALVFGFASFLSFGYWSISQLVYIFFGVLITLKQVKRDS